MSISKEHLQYLINVGKALHKLEEIANNDIFDDLSKHNGYWTSHDQDVYEKLDATRIQLKCISEEIWDVISLLQVNFEGENK